MQCRDFRIIVDSYLSDELLVETAHEVIKHIEACIGCRRELVARRELRDRLRSAFINDSQMQIRPEFVANLRLQLRKATPNLTQTSIKQYVPRLIIRARLWFAVAASLAFVTMSFISIIHHIGISHRPPPSLLSGEGTVKAEKGESADSPALDGQTIIEDKGADDRDLGIASSRFRKLALGDHLNCAVRFRLPAGPINIDQAGKQYDRVYIKLAKAVAPQKTALSGALRLVEAHSCVFEGHRFGHFVFKYGDHLVSLLVTGMGSPNSTNNKDFDASITSGVDLKEQVTRSFLIDGYRVSWFRTARHAVFIISDLPEAQNLAVARYLSPLAYDQIALGER